MKLFMKFGTAVLVIASAGAFVGVQAQSPAAGTAFAPIFGKAGTVTLCLRSGHIVTVSARGC